MYLLKILCPHCKQNQMLKFFGASEYIADCTPSELEKEQINNPTFIDHKQQKLSHFIAAGTCINCGRPVMIELEIDRDYLFALREYIANPEHKYNGPDPKILKTWPEQVPLYTHPSLPEEVNNYFLVLQKILPLLSTAPAIAIATSRNILQKSLDYLGAQGKTLYNQIEYLADKGIISNVLKDWAHVIREFGNAATHESKGSFEEAKEMVEFTKIFLQYTFELPDRINKTRAEFSKT